MSGCGCISSKYPSQNITVGLSQFIYGSTVLAHCYLLGCAISWFIVYTAFRTLKREANYEQQSTDSDSTPTPLSLSVSMKNGIGNGVCALDIGTAGGDLIVGGGKGEAV